MAKNGAKGGGRIGAVEGHSNPTTGLWTKRNTLSGRFLQAKK